MQLFDPPGESVNKLPQWREYVAMLERATTTDNPPDEARAELEEARHILSDLEAQHASARIPEVA
jgi:hypothetical protein